MRVIKNQVKVDCFGFLSKIANAQNWAFLGTELKVLKFFLNLTDLIFKENSYYA